MGAILGYARVSTGDQDVAGQTMRLTQADALKVFSDTRPVGPWSDPAWRPCLPMHARATRSRLSVSTALDAPLRSCLPPWPCSSARHRLLSLEERIDTNSAAGELVFHVFGAIAHFERRLIAERTKDGIAAARVRGKHPGRRPLGADQIAAALKLVQAGLSPTAAAKQVGLGRSTVYRELGRAGIERASNFST